MSGSLVDNEGFPRADVDIYAVRKARNKIICEYIIRNFQCYQNVGKEFIFISFNTRQVCQLSRHQLGLSPPILGLRNDHKTVMKLIEEKLHKLHTEAKEKKLLTQQNLGETQIRAEEREAPPLRGFAEVNVVTDGSPASLAVSRLKNKRKVSPNRTACTTGKSLKRGS